MGKSVTSNFITKLLTLLLFAGSFFSYQVHALDEVDSAEAKVSVEAKPDVVVETLTFLMPKTTSLAIDMARALIPENQSSVLNFLMKNGTVDARMENVRFDGGVYAPYFDTESPSYNQTLVFKFKHPSEVANASALEIIKNFSFEKALGVFNYLIVVVAVGVISLALSRMSWVSMTVEDGTKSWRKIIMTAPAVGTAFILVTPMPEYDGINVAQVMMVVAVLVSNFFAANLSMLSSAALFDHIIETTENDIDSQDVILKIQNDDTKEIAQQTVVKANWKVNAEKLMDTHVFNLLGGKPLTNANLRTSIAEFNDKHDLIGTELELTSLCFDENWAKNVSEVPACRYFLHRGDEGIMRINKKSTVGYEGSIEILNKAIPSFAGNEIYHYDDEKYRLALANVVPQLDSIFHKIYEYQKDVLCSELVRVGDKGSHETMTQIDFNSSFLCKIRDAGGGFDTDGQFYGATVDGFDGLKPHVRDMDIAQLYVDLMDVVADTGNAPVVTALKYQDERAKTFYYRGFFIAPIESVVTAVNYIRNSIDDSQSQRAGLQSLISKTVILDAIDEMVEVSVKTDPTIAKLLGHRFSSPHKLSEALGRVHFTHSSNGWLSTIFNLDELVADPSGEDGGLGVEDLRMRTIEPYSYMTETYYWTLPAAGVLSIFGGLLSIVMQAVGIEGSTGIYMIGKTLTTLGGILFLTALSAKLLSGVMFLWAAISLILSSIKRFIIFLVAAPIMAVKFFKDQFSETEDDEDNVTISRYLISALFRLSIDFSMVFVALAGSLVIGTIAANLAAYVILLYATSISEIGSGGLSELLTTLLVAIFLNIAVMWGLFQGVKMVNYIYDKTTDFVDDITGVRADEVNNELFGMVKSTLMPTAYIR